MRERTVVVVVEAGHDGFGSVFGIGKISQQGNGIIFTRFSGRGRFSLPEMG
jgi:hypothetical protein